MMSAMNFNVADNIVHRHQQKPYSCGAAATAMLLGVAESISRPLVQCTAEGTYMRNIHQFLDSELRVKSHLVSLHEDYYDIIDDLVVLSLKYPVLCSATYLWKNPGAGRPITWHHASIMADGVIFDPGEYRGVSGESYENTFNRKLTYREIIIVEAERPNFLKNFEQHQLCA